MNYNFKNGDIVLYLWKPGYSRWRKGIIVSNNFAMCNLPDFFGQPEFYISELDENDNVIDDKRSVAIPKDSEYIVKFEPGMEWCIGETSTFFPYVKYEKKRLEELEETKQSMEPFDMILVKYDGKWHNDFFEYYLDKKKQMIHTMSNHNIILYENWLPYENYDDYEQYMKLMNVDDRLVYKHNNSDESGVVEIENGNSTFIINTETGEFVGMKGNEFFDNPAKSLSEPDENSWAIKLDTVKIDNIKSEDVKEDRNEEVLKKLDDIIEKLNLLLLTGHTTTDPDSYIPRPIEPYYKSYNPEKYDPECWKIYCEHNNQHYEIKTSNNITSTFDFNNYNESKLNNSTSCAYDEKNYKYVESCVDLPNIPRSTMYGNEILEGSCDTYGLYCATKK